MTQVASNVPPGQLRPGGTWIQPTGDRVPVYVLDQEHIKRLLMEEARIISDPRDGAVQTLQAPYPKEVLEQENERLRKELEEMRVAWNERSERRSGKAS